MKKSSEQISTAQLLFSVGAFIQGSTLLTFGIHVFTKQEAWIGVISGCILSLPIIWMYTVLTKKFPGKSLIEINEIVLGKILGRLFSILYIFFFLSLAFLNTRDVGDFVGSYLLPITPMPVVLIMFIFVCAWAVRKGVKTITSYGTLFVIITFIVLLLNSLLLAKNIKLGNLLPLFSQPLKNYFEAAHTVAMLPICEIMAFFMLFPNLQNTKGAGKALWGGVAIGSATLLMNVVRDTAVLGPLAPLLTSPTFSTIRLINVGNIFTRMEVLYALVLIMLLFFKTSILFYAAVSGISQLLRLDSYKYLVHTFGAIIVIFAIAIFDSGVEHSVWLIEGSGPIYSTFFELLLPFITLVVAMVRGFFGKKEVAPL